MLDDSQSLTSTTTTGLRGKRGGDLFTGDGGTAARGEQPRHRNGPADRAGGTPPPTMLLNPSGAAAIDVPFSRPLLSSDGGDPSRGADADGSSSWSVLHTTASAAQGHATVPRASIAEEIRHIIDERGSQPLSQVRVEAAVAGVDEFSLVNSERAWLLQWADATTPATSRLDDATAATAATRTKPTPAAPEAIDGSTGAQLLRGSTAATNACLLYTSDAADE